jgi:hypothetical protein
MRGWYGTGGQTARGRADLATRMAPVHWGSTPSRCAVASSASGHMRTSAACAAYIPAEGRSTKQLSSVGTLAAGALQLPRSSEDVFGALLVGSCPPLASNGRTFRPLWNEEAMHRAYRMQLLLLRLHAKQPGGTYDWHAEYQLASHLAAEFRSLSALVENDLVVCSRALRSIVRNLVTLFGPAAGDIEINTHVERIWLRAYHCRALVLAASELVVNALSHAFAGCARGRIHVCLQSIDGRRACLRVHNDGAAPLEGDIDASASLAGRLGRLFGGRLSYRVDWTGASTAEIVFPLRA